MLGISKHSAANQEGICHIGSIFKPQNFRKNFRTALLVGMCIVHAKKNERGITDRKKAILLPLYTPYKAQNISALHIIERMLKTWI